MKTTMAAVVALFALNAPVPSFASVSDPGKLITTFTMLLGRLEVFTVLVLLLPEFWRG